MYQTSQLSTAYFKHAQKAICKKTLAKQYTVEYQLFTFMMVRLTWSCVLLTLLREYPLHITSPAKDQNSKIEVRFLLNAYWFCTIIKSKNFSWTIFGDYLQFEEKGKKLGGSREEGENQCIWENIKIKRLDTEGSTTYL